MDACSVANRADHPALSDSLGHIGKNASPKPKPGLNDFAWGKSLVARRKETKPVDIPDIGNCEKPCFIHYPLFSHGRTNDFNGTAHKDGEHYSPH